MNNSDYFSRLDRLDGLDTRGPKPYVALITIKPKPAPTTSTWPIVVTAIMLIPVLALMAGIVGTLITRAVL